MRSVLGRPEMVLRVAITGKMLPNNRVKKGLSTGVLGPGAWRRVGTQRPGKCRRRLARKRGRDLNVSPWRSLLGLSFVVHDTPAAGVNCCNHHVSISFEDSALKDSEHRRN